MSRILSPLTAIIVAFLAAAAAGPGLFYFRAQDLMASVVASHRAKAAAVVTKRAVQKAQGWDFWTIEMESVASDLKDEKARLQKKSDDIDRAAARVVAERQELERMRQELDKMRRQIDDRVVSIRSDELRNLRSLASTYATLTPQAAVAIFREMDDVTAVKILSLMKADVSGPIFEVMSTTPDGQPGGGTLAKRAAQLSEKIRLMKSGVVAGP